MNDKKQIEEMAKHCPCYFGEKCCIDAELPEKCDMLCQFGTYAEILYNAGYRKQRDKQNEWISVKEILPEDVFGKDRKIITVLVCTKSGRVSTSSRVRMMMVNKEKMNYEYTDIFEWSGQIAKKITHWMPLPKPPKMKGGAE